ncbi:hypothetical protein [Chitinophaga sp.]|uniref:hypothetical protein n=1 Tax=Chitinophaga sp. TaxID=1869181 RepID=UPI0031D6895D
MELLDELNKYYPDDRRIFVEKVDFVGETPYLILRFKLADYIDEEDGVDQRWKVNIKGFKEANIKAETSTSVECEMEHPLSWQYQDTNTSLYFRGVPEDIWKLYYDLTLLHNKLFEYYLEVDRFLNPVYFDKLLNAGAGLIAKGPHRLMLEYAALLEKHNVKTSMILNKGLNQDLDNSPLIVMFIAKTYIVAEEYNAIRLL